MRFSSKGKSARACLSSTKPRLSTLGLAGCRSIRCAPPSTARCLGRARPDRWSGSPILIGLGDSGPHFATGSEEIDVAVQSPNLITSGDALYPPEMMMFPQGE